MKNEVWSRNPPAALDRATPKAATKARETRKAANKPGWGRAGEMNSRKNFDVIPILVLLYDVFLFDEDFVNCRVV